MTYSRSATTLRRVPARLVLVAGLHGVMLWALLYGIRPPASATPLPVDLRGTVIDKPAPPRQPYVPHDPTLADPHLDIPTPRDPGIPVISELPSIDVDSGGITIGRIPEAGPAVVQPVMVGAAVDPRHPLTQPPYPMAAIRSSEEGALNLEVLVAADGRVRDAKVVQSSGFEQLDRAAMSEAKSRWRLRPATRDGVPFEQWLTLRVVFKLENR